MSVNPRVVLVTGGAYGIGYAIAARFSAAGDLVVIADRDTSRGQAACQNLPNTSFVQTDVQVEEQVSNAVQTVLKQHARLDVVCSNAGIERYRRADEYDIADWSAIMDTNLRAAFLFTRYAFPHLRTTRGCLVFTSSIQALANEKHISVYASSKAGLLGWMRGAAVDFAPEGVRVNAVCPGATATGMMEAALANESDAASALAALEAKIPLRRIGKASDIANAVYFLASEDAAYITGSCLVVDGGVLASLAL